MVLPPYGPALDPAERVFHAIRRVVEGRVYATPTDKQAAVERSLERLDADPERVRSFLSWHRLTVALA